MRVPISWLREYVDLPGSTSELAERITLAGLEVEAVHPADPADPADAGGGEVLEIGLTPDLARAMSVIGVAREVTALTGVPLRLPPPGPEIRPEDSAEFGIEIADPHRSNRYMGAVVRDVTIGESPAWMQERLRQAGQNPINNVVDITNYVMLEYGQPLHAFDYDLLASRDARAGGAGSPKIRVRLAEPGESVTTLDGVERKLDGSILLITDQAGPLAVAGVMGGLESGIKDDTRNLLLEAATFDNIGVRSAAQQLKLHTEASSRFSRGIPAALNEVALRRAVDLFVELAGGRLTSVVDRYPVHQRPRRAYLTASEVRRQLGFPVALPMIQAALERLEFAVEALDGPIPTPLASAGTAALGLAVAPAETILRATAPWYRLDVEYPADLTEEVARVLGYASIPETRLADTLPPPRRNPVAETEERLRDLLVGCGLDEHINYTLSTVENHAALGLAPASPELFVTLQNPLSANRRVMRRSLLVSGVEALSYNLRYTDRERSFEVGRVYLPESGDGLRPHEERRLAILLTGPRRRPSVHPDPGAAEAMDFFDLKGILEALFAALGWQGRIEYVPRPGEAPFGPRCAEIRANGERLGVLGELHPKAALRFDLGGRRICLAELKIEPFVRREWQRDVLPEISNYPPVVEDLAFVVQEDLGAEHLAAVIRRAGGPTLVRLELFDLYRGESLPPRTKSLAFQLTYQSTEGTLENAEVAALRKAIEEAVAGEVGGKLRA